jgi:hypothetical protein
MNSALTEMDGKMIAASVATRQKALLVLKASRRPSFIGSLAPSVATILMVVAGLSGLQLPFWPKLIISVACMLSFASVAFSWRVQRQLVAVIDLLLLSEDQKRETSVHGDA